MEWEEQVLKRIIKEVLIESGLVKDEINQREAYRLFGESRVRTWVNQGKIKPMKFGSKNAKVTYSLNQLQSLRYK